jgi:hypothetical protein
MNQLKLLPVLLFFSSITYSQQTALVFKKGTHAVSTFWKGDFIAFQTSDKQWQKGELMRIQNDSFYIRPMVVLYGMMHNDTLRYDIQPYSLADVYAMPKRGVLIDYRYGSFQISPAGGHQHFYWIKSGWLFRTGGAGHAGFHLLNAAVDHNLSVSGRTLGIDAGAFLFGILLKHLYKLTIRTGKKYHLQILTLSNKPA